MAEENPERSYEKVVRWTLWRRRLNIEGWKKRLQGVPDVTGPESAVMVWCEG